MKSTQSAKKDEDFFNFLDFPMENDLDVNQYPDPVSYDSLPEKKEESYNNIIFLTEEKELLLFRRSQSGDVEARNELILHFLPLVKSIRASYQNKGVDKEDLLQIGCEALFHALRKYSPEKGRFGSYAIIWIRSYMQQAIIRSPLIRLPDQLAKSVHAQKVRNQKERPDSPLSVAERREQISTLVKKVKTRISVIESFDIFQFSSIDSEDVPEKHLIDKEMNLFDQTANNELRELIKNLLQKLDKKTIEILNMRFGFLNEEEMTLDKIGKGMGVHRETVRQAQVKAINILRSTLKEEGYEMSDFF